MGVVQVLLFISVRCVTVHKVIHQVACISLLLIFASTFTTAQHVELNLIATDTLSDTRLLTIGVDPTATDNIDAPLGEYALGALTSNYEARLIGDDIGKPGLGLGVIRDFRGIPGFQPFTLQYELFLRPKVFGTTVTLQWSLPLASGIINAQLRDIYNIFYNVNMMSTSFVQIRGGMQRFIITLTYNGLPSTSRYTLTTIDVPVGAGTTTKFPNQIDYASGQSVTLTALPAVGYKFLTWTGDTTVPNIAVLPVIMWKNKTIAAIYEQLPPPVCTIIKSVSPAPSAGNIRVFPQKASYNCGELLQLTAEAANCWKFLRWSGDTISTDPVLNVLLWKNRNIVAEFVPSPPTLDVTSQPSYGGYVLKNPDYPAYLCNDVVSLTAFSNPGFKFIGWEGDTIVLNQTTISVALYKSRRLVARFCDINSGLCGPVITIQTKPTGLQFTVDGITYTNSHIFVWQLGERHELGVPMSMQTQFSPSSQWSRYRFKEWNPPQTQPVFDYTVRSSMAQFTAIFTTQYALVTENSPANGGQISISPASPDGFYNDSTSVLLTAVPNTNWKFRDWTGDKTDTLNPISVLMNGSKRIRANYTDKISPDTKAITFITSPPNLSVVIDNKIYGTPVTFRWITGEEHEISVPTSFQIQYPPAGPTSGTRYVFLNWDDNKPATHKILVTNFDQTFRANFQTQYQLVTGVTPIDGGSINISPSSPDGFYTTPIIVKLHATENSKYRFERWIGTVTGKDTLPDLDVLMDAPKNIVAQFRLKSKDQVPVFITSIPIGLTVVIDGATTTTPVTMYWLPGEDHEISVPSSYRVQYSQITSRTRYQFDRWSDNGLPTHRITIPLNGMRDTAYFKTQHQLTVEVSPPAGGVVSKSPDDPEGFYFEGSQVQLSANANIGYAFRRWNSVDSLDVPTRAMITTMWKPKMLRAYFDSIGAGRICLSTTNLLFQICASEEILPQPQQITLQNCGYDSFTWNITINYLNSSRAWLRVSPDSGTLKPSAITTLVFNVLQHIGVGNHQAEITLRASNADNPNVKILVMYRVLPKPHFEFNPDSLVFRAKQFDPQIPSGRTVQFSDFSTCSVQWTVKTDTPWVQVSQTGGSSNSATITVSVTRTDLPIGIHLTRIRFESFQADNSPIFITIIYEIRGAIPDKPDSLIATKVDDHSISLQWKDMSYNEDGFYIERFNKKILAWERVGKVDKNQASYMDNNLEACTEYKYRVQAYNESGTSEYSNEATATTCRERGVLTNETAFIYPNPVKDVSTFSFSLSKSADVTIRIVDAANTVIRSFHLSSVQADNCNTQITWDGINDKGEQLANGVYFFIIETSAGERAVGKMALLK